MREDHKRVSARVRGRDVVESVGAVKRVVE